MNSKEAERTEDVERTYITLPEIVRDSGRTRGIVYNWFKYHGFMDLVYVLGKPVAKRADYERFKAEHPELIKNQTAEPAGAVNQ